jgi:flagellin
MAFSINTNISSLQAQYYLNKTEQFQAKTINEVTSGLRIVNAGDDAAGLAVANQYRSDQAVLTQGVQNLNSATSTLQTIDSGMSDIGNLLDRARTLATESASTTFTGDRGTLNSEFQSVLGEINRQAQATGIDTGGTFAKSLQVFVGGGTAGNGVSAGDNGSVMVDLSNATVDTKSLGLTGYTAATSAVTNVSTYATNLGAGTATLTFNGAGFSDAGKVNVTVNLAGVSDMNSLAAAINSGIAQAASQSGSNFTAFQNAGISAVVDNSGANPVLDFTAGSTAFQVSAAAASTGAKILGGGTGTNAAAVTMSSGGTSQINGNTFTAMSTAADSQSLTFQAVDDAGKLQTKVITLQGSGGDSSGTSIANAVAAINTQLQGTGIQGLQNIVAVADANGTDINFISSSDFNINFNTPTSGTDGFTAGASAAAVTGSASTVDISNATNAQNAVAALASAVQNLGSAQAVVGKGENVLNYASNLASTQLTNLASSESQIRDADLAAEAANLSKAQILSQAGVAALAQANSAPQAILSLLKG